MGTSLYPMLMRHPFVRVMIGGAGVPGQHVDEANLVRWILLCADSLSPCHAIVVGAKRRPLRIDQARKAVASGLKRMRLALAHHHDSCLTHDLLGRRGPDLGKICWLRCRDFLCRKFREGGPATNEQSQR